MRKQGLLMHFNRKDAFQQKTGIDSIPSLPYNQCSPVWLMQIAGPCRQEISK